MIDKNGNYERNAFIASLDSQNGELLENILLSDNVCKRFIDEYNGNEKFRGWIDTLIPEVQSCFNQAQNTPWHIYGVMEHILYSVEHMNMLSAELIHSERKLLAYVMFFHDLGKPEYHRVKEVEGQKFDSFTFHNLGSKKIAERTLKWMGFSDDDRAKIIKLVCEHDVFLKLSDNPQHDWQVKLTPDFLKKYIKELDDCGDGKQLFKYLILVGLADNMAQNPKMTGESLAFIKKVEEMLNCLTL